MIKPDSTGESLESILASIRKSLAEQSTDVLEERTTADAQGEAKSGVPRQDGLTQRLAGTATDAPHVDVRQVGDPQVEKAKPGGHVLSDPAADSPTPSATPAPTTPSSATRKDPLWFLSRRGEPPAKEAGRHSIDASQPATAGGKAPAGPNTSRAEVVRGPLPPFFGSSAEAAKVEVLPAPVQPIASGVGIMMPPVVSPAIAVRAAEGAANAVRTSEPETAHEPSRMPAGINAEGAGGVRNGKAHTLFGQAATESAEGKPAEGTPEGDNPHIHALEIMVSDLLRPMLQRWLDENMPRLVSAALKDEAARMSGRDAKKP
jgi:cell pole-organizing protein PopZ